jgi:hypothetical protein
MLSRGARSIVMCTLLFASTLIGQQGTTTSGAKCATPEIVNDSKYSPGQVWNYKNRAGESSSTITILRVESLPKVGVIVHVRIDGIKLRNCSGGPSPTSIQHAPFAKDAIDRSVVTLIKERQQLPEYEAGYSDWKAHCGGVYTITVAEMLKVDEATYNNGVSCSE